MLIFHSRSDILTLFYCPSVIPYFLVFSEFLFCRYDFEVMLIFRSCNAILVSFHCPCFIFVKVFSYSDVGTTFIERWFNVHYVQVCLSCFFLNLRFYLIIFHVCDVEKTFSGCSFNAQTNLTFIFSLVQFFTMSHVSVTLKQRSLDVLSTSSFMN